MKEHKLFIDLSLKAEFYDVDSMRIVWHGNYIKYYEQARCVLLDKIGYNYNEMEHKGIAWPIVKLDVKYIKPIIFGQEFCIRATLDEYENRLKISYLVYDQISGAIINRGTTTQMAVDMESGESLLVSPAHLIKIVEDYMGTEKVSV